MKFAKALATAFLAAASANLISGCKSSSGPSNVAGVAAPMCTASFGGASEILPEPFRQNAFQPPMLYTTMQTPDDPIHTEACTTATSGQSGGLVKTTGNNTIPVYVADAATTGGNAYLNEPLVSVTICEPNHTLAGQCVTVSNILLDTGSYGLRVFSTTLPGITLTQQTVTVHGTSYNLAECQLFGSGADWGPVKAADVILGNQTATNISIQVIDHSFTGMPASCANYSPDTDPCTARYNGILGVGMFAQDCGPDCASTSLAVNQLFQYFGCNGGTCANTFFYTGANHPLPVPLNEQVVNPVSALGAGFNNGVSLTFPSVGVNGGSAVVGSMTMGISVAAGNVPGASVVPLPADPNGQTDCLGSDFQTIFDSCSSSYIFGNPSGVTCSNASNATQAFIDSGSNNYYIASTSALATCADASSFFCPTTALSLQSTMRGYNGTPTKVINFSIGNADVLSNTGNSAFNNIGGPDNAIFDWGMPFFYGRTIYVGIDGTSATWNAGATTPTGPYWAL
jgi:hypothetical protein